MNIIIHFFNKEPKIFVEGIDSTKTTIESLNGDIQITDVVFSYPSRPDVQILHGIDLHIKHGQTVALVGPSGCGKSTITKLIPRIYDFMGNVSLPCK